MIQLFDSHCHIEDNSFVDVDDVVLRARQKLCGLVCSGVDPTDFSKVIGFAQKYFGFVFASLGVHPEYADKLNEVQINGAIAQIKESRDQIVSIGEVGLDYFWQTDPLIRENQKKLFVKFITLAKELDKPLVVHIRVGKDKQSSAYEDAFQILEKEGAKKVLLHMFGVRKLLDRALASGWHISTNAIVQSGKEYKRTIKAVPLERLLLETDAPYLVPEPLKSEGITRNEPVFVEYVARRVAQIREISVEEVCTQTTINAKNFFGI